MALSKLKPNSFADTVEGNPSLIINGDMTVAQRGTSATNLNAYGSVDRFKINSTGLDNAAVTNSQSTTAPDGFEKSLKLDVTTAETTLEANEFLRVTQWIEARNLTHLAYGTSAAKSVTVSFWVRSSLTGTYALGIYTEDSLKNITSTYTINTADTWEHKSITFAGDTGGTINDDNGHGFQVDWFLATGSNWGTTDSTSWGTYANGRLAYGHTANVLASTHDWYITGVKLEVGSTATPFKYETYAENLNKCQRYYVKKTPGNNSIIGIGMAYGTTSAYTDLYFPVEMRTTPSGTFSSTNGHWEFRNRSSDKTNSGAPSLTTGNAFSARMDMALNGSVTDGIAGWIEADDAAAYYELNAEL